MTRSCLRGVAVFTVLVVTLSSLSPLFAAERPALPPDLRRVLMLPIAEDEALVRARLVKVLRERRQKSFKAEQKRFDDFDRRLNRGRFGKFHAQKVNVPFVIDWNEPEFKAFRALSSATSEWRRVLREEEQYYLDIIEDGRRETWLLVSEFVPYSVIRTEELGYAYQNLIPEVRRLEAVAASDASPLIKEFARDELAADNGIIEAAKHRQNTIYQLLQALEQGAPDSHLARYKTWMAESRAASAAREQQRRQNDQDFLFLLGLGVAAWTAIGIAGGGGASPMPISGFDCRSRGGTWFENQGLPFCVGYK
jgi:hypothetical protein